MSSLQAKLGKLHGIDFYIPENLSIFDFMKSSETYLPEGYASYDKKAIYVVPLVFFLKSAVTTGEYACQIVLKWNENAKKWLFSIAEYDPSNEASFSLIDVTNPNDKITKWITDEGTVVSRVMLMPSSRILIPSGIHVNLPDNVYIKFENKSGISAKRGLVFGSSVVDSDYTGEVHLSVINTSSLPVYIKAGEKLLQGIPMFQPKVKEFVEMSSTEELYKDKSSERGDGGFGSSGK